MMKAREIEIALSRLPWLLAAAALLLAGCAGSFEHEDDAGVTLPQAEQPVAAFESGEAQRAESAADLLELNRLELVEGPGSQDLAVSGLLRDLGVIRLLESYLINLPPAAEFLFSFEIAASGSANRHHYAGPDVAGEAISAFEGRVLQSAWAAAQSMPDFSESSVLDKAFFEVFERCGRASPWPEIKLFEMYEGSGFDVLPERIETEFGMSQFEYLQLRHQCTRHAATYPTLDPVVRDEMLAPQRAHFARVILDQLDNELPLVEVPPRYRAELADLRANEW